MPLVRLELPGLTSCKDSRQAAPVVRLELLGRVNNDEAQWPLRIDGRDEPRDVEEVGVAGGRVGWAIDTIVQKRFDVAHAEKR